MYRKIDFNSETTTIILQLIAMYEKRKIILTNPGSNWGVFKLIKVLKRRFFCVYFNHKCAVIKIIYYWPNFKKKYSKNIQVISAQWLKMTKNDWKWQ